MNPNVSAFSSAGHARLSPRKRPITRSISGKTPPPGEQQAGPSPRPETTCYRACLPIMVLAFRDNHHAAVTIPAGEVFDVIGPSTDDRFIVINIKGEELLVFESDVKERGELTCKEQAQGA